MTTDAVDKIVAVINKASTPPTSFTFEHRGSTYKYDGRTVSNDEFISHIQGNVCFVQENVLITDIGKLLKFLGDLDGGNNRPCTVNFTYDIEKNELDFYAFSCDYNPPPTVVLNSIVAAVAASYEFCGNVCDYPEPYEDMNEDDLMEIERDYECDLKEAFREAFRKRFGY